VGTGRIKPSEFWRLTPKEVWWFIEALKPIRMYGDMSESEVVEIYRKTYGAN
jgi:hypothetical protein